MGASVRNCFSIIPLFTFIYLLIMLIPELLYGLDLQGACLLYANGSNTPCKHYGSFIITININIKIMIIINIRIKRKRTITTSSVL